MNISSMLSSEYPTQIKKAEKKYTSEVESTRQTQKQSDAEKLADFKKEIWNEIKSMPRSSSISWSINITDAAFERMMNEPAFKEKMMNLLKESAANGRYPIKSSITTIDENGYRAYSYNDPDIAKEAYSTHSKDKDNFYKKKAKDQDVNDIWEQEQRERDQRREILDEEYKKKLYTSKVYRHKEEIARLYAEKTFVKE